MLQTINHQISSMITKKFNTKHYFKKLFCSKIVSIKLPDLGEG